jgi:hypothetical protein
MAKRIKQIFVSAAAVTSAAVKPVISAGRRCNRTARSSFLSEPKPRKPDYLPAIILGTIVGLICVVIWLFPYLQGYVQHQNCVGSGRVDCG